MTTNGVINNTQFLIFFLLYQYTFKCNTVFANFKYQHALLSK